jgi:transcriptional regulator with XRE-family HTH domain
MFAKRLKEAMQLKRMSVARLARQTGIGESTIFRYLSGDREPIYGNLIAIATALDVDLDFLAGRDDAQRANVLSELVEKLTTDLRSTLGISTAKDAPADSDSMRVAARIPVVGRISQGLSLRFTDEGYPRGESLFGVPRLGDDDPHAFGFIFEGDSMTLRVLDGDIVICSPSEQWKSRDLVVLRKTNGEITVKDISERKGYFVLRSYNPAYDLEEIPKSEVSFVHKLTSIRPGGKPGYVAGESKASQWLSEPTKGEIPD